MSHYVRLSFSEWQSIKRDLLLVNHSRALPDTVLKSFSLPFFLGSITQPHERVINHTNTWAHNHLVQYASKHTYTCTWTNSDIRISDTRKIAHMHVRTLTYARATHAPTHAPTHGHRTHTCTRLHMHTHLWPCDEKMKKNLFLVKKWGFSANNCMPLLSRQISAQIRLDPHST